MHLAELSLKSGKVSVQTTIKNKLEALERANNPESMRQSGAWRGAARQKHYDGRVEDSREVYYVVMILIDYNTVESILLACAVLVFLAGIIFLSARFTGALASYYQSDYDALTTAVAMHIIMFCVYFLVVLSFKIWYFINRELAERFILCSIGPSQEYIGPSQRIYWPFPKSILALPKKYISPSQKIHQYLHPHKKYKYETSVCYSWRR